MGDNSRELDCPECGGEIDYPLVGEHQEQSPYLRCKKCSWEESAPTPHLQDNELPDDFPDIVYLRNGHRGLVEISPVSRGDKTMYRKDGVAPEDLDTDESRTLWRDRIKKLESENDALNDELDTQNETLEQLEADLAGHKQQLIDFKLISKKQAACTHHHNGVSQYSPFQHAWKCDKCHHIMQDE